MGYYAKDGAYVHDEHDMEPIQHEGIPRSSGIIEETQVEKHWQKIKQRQVEKENEQAREIDERLKTNERKEREFKAAGIIKNEKMENYKNQSFFKKMFDKRKGKDAYSRQNEIYNEALEQARGMSELELDDIIRRGGR